MITVIANLFTDLSLLTLIYADVAIYLHSVRLFNRGLNLGPSA